VSRPFTPETGKAASRLGVEARRRLREERVGLEDDPRKILDRIEWHSKEIVRLTTKLARVKSCPPARALERPVSIPTDKRTPSLQEAVARQNPSNAASINGRAAPEPAQANGNPARTPKLDKVGGYIEELEAHYAQGRQASDADREKEERRARAIESRLRRW
jgi:hypothetical protein